MCLSRQKVWSEGSTERRSQCHRQLNQTKPAQFQTTPPLPAGSQGLLNQL